MHNFTYHNPVKIVFGKNSINKLNELIAPKQKILLAYGGGSIKSNGVYQQIISALPDHQIFEFAGIEANPEYDTLVKAINICKAEKIDLILAVGGGSVIDGCKLVALASHYDGEAWDILTNPTLEFTKAIPLGTVLTLPATGSEMNCGSVISRRSIGAKLAFGNPLVYPKFSILDPEVTYTLPKRQLQNGVIDPFIHVTEQYLTTDINTDIQDGFAESVLRTLVKVGKDIVNGSTNYDTRANWMWAATNALNGIIGVGVDQDWATHMIGHELTAAYGLDHAQTLAIVAPQLWRFQFEAKVSKLAKLGRNVWGLENLEDRLVATQAIILTEEFFHSLEVATKLSDYNIVIEAEKIANTLFAHNSTNLGENKAINKEAVIEILTKAQ
ncbi:MAG: iron-containing alcohol dehydrogenase [Burkholderiales bacterium]|nr:iron-containing alcohol dehydrogenase [Burkholderiales bacterium]